MAQLPFPLSLPASYRREDFITGDANKDAAAWIELWPDWPRPYRALNLFGPKGAGKTHLGAILAEISGAKTCTKLAAGEKLPVAQGEAILLEACDSGLYDEEALFHLLNAIAEESGSLLMLSRIPLSQMDIKLADTRSRLRSLAVQGITPPDDQLFKAVLFKLCADRQCVVPETVIDYLVVRIERSYEAAYEVVTALDAEALIHKKPVTLGLARSVLAHYVKTGDA